MEPGRPEGDSGRGDRLKRRQREAEKGKESQKGIIVAKRSKKWEKRRGTQGKTKEKRFRRIRMEELQ